MISCEKGSIICNKKQYKETTLLHQIKLGFHLLYCKTCVSFSKKNTKLTMLCDKANLHSLSVKEKETLKERIDQNI